MTMRLDAGELISAVCLHVASRKAVSPAAVEVELAWDEQYGFTARVRVRGREQYLVEANLLDAVGYYLLQQYRLPVYRSQIRLVADDQLWAEIAD